MKRSMRQSLSREFQKWGGMAKFRDRPRLAERLYRASVGLDGGNHAARRIQHVLKARRAGVDPLNFVVIGTTGTCNASCVHCPTGKASTANSPRGTMPMEIFKTIIDGIVEEGIEVQDQISFGLFGDSLVDPLVVERARYLRDRLPEVRLSVVTNGAAFNAAKHRALGDYASVIALHCESLVPKTYDYLMAPLRAKNVHPKYERILETYPGKVHVSVPVSRANLYELESVRDWFMARGAADVVFDPMSSRCAEDMTVFDTLSLAPMEIRCSASAMADLVVDCDGVVLNCCQDFSRLEPIGDLARETLRETLASVARADRKRQLAENRHDEIVTCSRCMGDARSPRFPFDMRETGAFADADPALA